MEPIGFATMFKSNAFNTSPIPPGATLLVSVVASGNVNVTWNIKLAITATTAAENVPIK